MSKEPSFRCELCGVAMADKERMLVLSAHSVRLRKRSKRRSSLFPQEFPDGSHEKHFHEACLLQSASSVLLRLYENDFPDQPLLAKTKSARR
jgi:hypothetical protein